MQKRITSGQLTVVYIFMAACADELNRMNLICRVTQMDQVHAPMPIAGHHL
jgi:hypothetical protein